MPAILFDPIDNDILVSLSPDEGVAALNFFTSHWREAAPDRDGQGGSEGGVPWHEVDWVPTVARLMARYPGLSPLQWWQEVPLTWSEALAFVHPRAWMPRTPCRASPWLAWAVCGANRAARLRRRGSRSLKDAEQQFPPRRRATRTAWPMRSRIGPRWGSPCGCFRLGYNPPGTEGI